jgi:hypothetical protein
VGYAARPSVDVDVDVNVDVDVDVDAFRLVGVRSISSSITSSGSSDATDSNEVAVEGVGEGNLESDAVLDRLMEGRDALEDSLRTLTTLPLRSLRVTRSLFRAFWPWL